MYNLLYKEKLSMKKITAHDSITWFTSFFNKENIILLLILFFGLLFRFLTVTNIETGGDAASYWFAAKRLYYGLPYILNHHTVRFGMILPVTLSQCIFGTHPIVYYIMPLLFYVLQIIFLYKIAVRACGINIAFLSSMLLILYPKMFSHAVQLKPDGFLAAYILISAWFIVKFNDSSKHQYWYLLAASFFMFMAYLTKETALFFIPGFAICIWMMKRKYNHVLFFGFVLFALFLCETALYYYLAGMPLGRAQIVAGSHLSSGNLMALPSVWSLLSRYAQLNVFEKLYFYAYILSTCYLVIRIKKLKPDVTIQSLIIIPLVFFILLTFAVKSIVPVVPAMSFNPRHLVPAAPFMCFILAYAIVTVKNSLRMSSTTRNHISPATQSSVAMYAWIIAVLSVVSTIATIIVLPHFPQAARSNFLREHPFVETFRYYRLLNDAYAHGIPIIQEKVVADRWKKPVEAVQFFLNQGYTLQEACQKAKVTEKDYLYCYKRVQQGDYKTFKIFTHIFWDANFKLGSDITFPKMQEAVIKAKSIGFIVNEECKKKVDYTSQFFNNEENVVVVMQEKPLRVKKMKLKDFLTTS